METLNYEVLKKSGYNGYIKESAPEKVMLVCFRYKNDEDYDFLRIKKD